MTEYGPRVSSEQATPQTAALMGHRGVGQFTKSRLRRVSAPRWDNAPHSGRLSDYFPFVVIVLTYITNSSSVERERVRGGCIGELE